MLTCQAKESIMTTHFKLCFIEANILLSIVCNFQCILIVNITLLDITRKVEAVARDKGCQSVKKWIESIKNHLYWSVWQGVKEGCQVEVNHVQNVHDHEDPLFPKCLQQMAEAWYVL